MRAVLLIGARAVLLAGPAVLAFFSGGYFDEPRVWAGLVVWVLVVLSLLGTRDLIPRGRGGRLALGALGLLATWTLLSVTWAPIAGSAYHAGQRVILYAGGLLAAAALLRERRVQRVVEPALAAGALVVIGYGLSERLLPGLLHFARSISAQGRLEQPLTYWNAMGVLAAIGFVLCAAVAGDATRARWLRAVASAASAPLGMGLYLSVSRGALFACVAGLIALLAARSDRAQLTAILLSSGAGVLAAVAAAPFSGVTALTGAQGTREWQGAITFLLLAVIAISVGLWQFWRTRSEQQDKLRLPRRVPLIALLAISLGLGLAIVLGAKEHSRRPLSPRASRYVTLQSNRYDYWRVAWRAFEDQPLRGAGAGAWAVYWLRLRPINESAQDAHSLPLQTMAELGLLGTAMLAAFLIGVGLAAREAHSVAPALAAGPIAGSVVWLAHSPLDWDWQMPTVTLIALVLAGALIALAEGSRAGPGNGAINSALGPRGLG